MKTNFIAVNEVGLNLLIGMELMIIDEMKQPSQI